MKSPEIDFEDFLRRVRPWRVEMERFETPARDARHRRYQYDTHAIALAMQTGDRIRLEAAMYGVDMGDE